MVRVIVRVVRAASAIGGGTVRVAVSIPTKHVPSVMDEIMTETLNFKAGNKLQKLHKKSVL